MIKFQKYVAAGNDFIVINNWDESLELTSAQIVSLCDRRFGIGADGVLLLSPDESSDFRMNYFNADGSRGEMCGNGARSLVMFARSNGKAGDSGTFLADDGLHDYQVKGEQIEVQILVNDELHPSAIPNAECGFINTGVPHLIIPVEDINTEELDSVGKTMNAHPNHPQGTNVNIVNRAAGITSVRTWERGVNMETLACGTGATAAAIYIHEKWKDAWPISLVFPGGILVVDYRSDQYWLQGPTGLVFDGHFTIPKLQRI